MKQWYLIVIGLVAIGVLWWVYAAHPTQQTNQQTVSTSTVATSTTVVATSTVATSTVATSTASTSSKPTPKQIAPAPVWTEFLKAFHCFKVKLAPSVKVNSFRQEGMPVAVGSQQAYQCSNGHTWVY